MQGGAGHVPGPGFGPKPTNEPFIIIIIIFGLSLAA